MPTRQTSKRKPAKSSAKGLFVFALSVAACRSPQGAPSAETRSSVAATSAPKERCGDTARAWLSGGAALVDVRTPQEFSEGHLEGAINVPVEDLGARLGDVPEGKVVVYCRSGRRAEKARAQLETAQRDVYLLGGIGDWDSKNCAL